MANQLYNFYYDPLRQGFDPLAWKSLFGNPVVSNQLTLSDCAIIHLADILRCDAVFNINISAPSVGDEKKIGFIQYNKNAYIYFHILNDVLTAETSDGVTAYSIPITWQGSWSNTDTQFGIKWEAGAVTFSVGGIPQTVIAYNTTLDIISSVVPGDPLSIYLSDFSTSTSLVLNYIDVKSIQSYILETSDSSVVVGSLIKKDDRINISESITIGQVGTMNISVSDLITISESVTVSISSLLLSNNVTDTLTTTESVTAQIV